MASPGDAAPRRAAQRRGVDPLHLMGALLVVALLLASGWLAWLLLVSDWMAGRRADTTVAELRERWAADQTVADEPQLLADPHHGAVEWLLTLPGLDDAREWPVVVGAEEGFLEGAVVWYRGTAQPGQVGNFAVAANCLGGGAPFGDIRDLVTGDQVVVESHDALFTYELVSSPGDLTVQADEDWVLEPVPGHADTEPSQALITLVTCEDRIPTDDRAVGFGVLTATEMKQ